MELQPLNQKVLDKSVELKARVFAQMRLIITFLLIVALFFVILVRTGIKDKLDEDFWLKFAVGIFLNVAMLIIWVPSGKESGEKDDRYIENKKQAAAKISEILNSPSKLSIMDLFCDYATEINRITRIKRILGRQGIKYSDYADRYAFMSIADIKNHNHFTRTQKSTILKVRKGINVKPIHSSQITSLSNNYGEVFSVNNEEKNAQAFKTVIKMVSVIVMTIVIAFMAFSTNDKITLASFAQFFIWVGTMVFNMFTCHQMGYGLVTVQRNSYHLRLIDFACRFDAWIKEKESSENSVI